MCHLRCSRELPRTASTCRNQIFTVIWPAQLRCYGLSGKLNVKRLGGILPHWSAQIKPININEFVVMVYFLFIFCEGTQIERSSFAFAPKIHVNNKLIFIDDIEGRELIRPFEDFQAACSIYISINSVFFIYKKFLVIKLYYY